MIKQKLKKIKILLLDVDGVLNDGGIIYDDNNVEEKKFNVKDGLGIRFLINSGIQVAIVTGRRSKALLHRCNNLGITNIYDGIKDKGAVLDSIVEKFNVTSDEIAFIGDDLPDIPLMKKIGIPVAVADAHETVCENSIFITQKNGGQGAVREVCEAILKAQNLWEKILDKYL